MAGGFEFEVSLVYIVRFCLQKERERQRALNKTSMHC